MESDQSAVTPGRLAVGSTGATGAIASASRRTREGKRSSVARSVEAQTDVPTLGGGARSTLTSISSSSSSSSSTNLSEKENEDTFIGWHPEESRRGGTVAAVHGTLGRTAGVSGGVGRYRGMEPVSSTAAAATTAVTSMDPPLQVLCRLWLDGGRASSDDTPPPPLTIPLSTRYTRCLVCDLEAKQWMQAVSRAAATCRGPTAASPETPPPTATAADVEPPYVVDWRARHRVAYWETVRQRQRQVAVEEEGTGRTSGTPERTAATAMADTSTAAALPQVVTLYRAHHLDAYDYAFFLCTILLFPVAWLIILFRPPDQWRSPSAPGARSSPPAANRRDAAATDSCRRNWPRRANAPRHGRRRGCAPSRAAPAGADRASVDTPG
eukprot:ctg_1620.g304